MTSENAELAELANRHLWGQFSSLGRSVDGMTVVEAREGCYIQDTEGKRYLDGLAGLYTTQAGYGQPASLPQRALRPRPWPSSRSGPTPTRRSPARRSPRIARPRRSQPCVLHQRWI